MATFTVRFSLKALISQQQQQAAAFSKQSLINPLHTTAQQQTADRGDTGARVGGGQTRVKREVNIGLTLIRWPETQHSQQSALRLNFQWDFNVSMNL